MEYKKSRDTLTSRLGTGPSVNQETIAKIHTLLTDFDSFCTPNGSFVFATHGDEGIADTVEHKQQFCGG